MMAEWFCMAMPAQCHIAKYTTAGVRRYVMCVQCNMTASNMSPQDPTTTHQPLNPCPCHKVTKMHLGPYSYPVPCMCHCPMFIHPYPSPNPSSCSDPAYARQFFVWAFIWHRYKRLNNWLVFQLGFHRRIYKCWIAYKRKALSQLLSFQFLVWIYVCLVDMGICVYILWVARVPKKPCRCPSLP